MRLVSSGWRGMTIDQAKNISWDWNFTGSQMENSFGSEKIDYIHESRAECPKRVDEQVQVPSKICKPRSTSQSFNFHQIQSTTSRI